MPVSHLLAPPDYSPSATRPKASGAAVIGGGDPPASNQAVAASSDRGLGGNNTPRPGRPGLTREIIESRGENIRALTDEAQECIERSDFKGALRALSAINRELREGAVELGYPHLFEAAP